MRRAINVKKIYRDNVHQKITGVCAGIARRFGYDKWVVRLATVALFMMFPKFTVFSYAIASLVLPKRY